MPHLARSQILTGFAPLARSLGLSPERLAKSVALDLSALNDLDARISAKAFAAMLERAADLSNLQDFGLRLAESRELGILGPVGIVIRQETDLRSALQSLIRYMPVHNESLDLRLEDERGIAVLALTVRLSGLDGARHVTELSIGTFFRVMRKLAGPDWKPSRICFEHTAPRSDATHRRFFGCRGRVRARVQRHRVPLERPRRTAGDVRRHAGALRTSLPRLDDAASSRRDERQSARACAAVALQRKLAAPIAWRAVWVSIAEPCIAIWRRPIRLSRRSSPKCGSSSRRGC